MLLHTVAGHSFSLLFSIQLWYITQFIYQPAIGGHLGGFQFRAVRNGAVINILVLFSWEIYMSFFCMDHWEETYILLNMHSKLVEMVT